MGADELLNKYGYGLIFLDNGNFSGFNRIKDKASTQNSYKKNAITINSLTIDLKTLIKKFEIIDQS